MSEYLLSNTPLALLFAYLGLLKLESLTLMTADLPVEMTEGIWYMQMWTLNSFLETKPILKSMFNKYLGKSNFLIFHLLFLVDLKQRGRTTRRKDNHEVWNRVPLWLCFINICYNPLPEWSFVWESGSRCLALPDSYFSNTFYFPVVCDTVLRPFVFIVLWGIQARSKSCRNDRKTCTDTVGSGSALLFLWAKKGQMLCFAMWLLDEKYCFSSLSSFK